MNYPYALLLSQRSCDGIYQPQENICFFPSLRIGGCQQLNGKINWTLFKDNFREISSGEFDLSNLGGSIEIKKPEAGQYRFRIETTTPEGELVSAEIGAVSAPEAIRPHWDVPADFDKFWDQQKARLAAVPIEYRLSPLRSSALEAFRVKVDCVDNVPVSGIYMRPKNIRKKSCPAIINFHGAGVKCSMPNDVVPYVDSGFIAMDINAHGIDDDREIDYYAKLSQNELSDYRLRGFLDGHKEDVYFLNMFLRAKRAIDFITAQEQWDGVNLVMHGGSQGAFQAIAAAYLDSRVSALCTAVPAGTDMAGGGWPFYATLYERSDSERENINKCAPYFDNISFGSRLEIPMFTMAGFIDMSCYAGGIFAFYNTYKGKNKKILHCASMTHGPTLSFLEEMRHFVIKSLK